MPVIYVQDDFGCPAPVEVSTLGLGTDDQTAAEVAYTPGNVAGATTVQEALDALAACQVCAIQSTNDCAGGVGAAYAMRQAQLADGVLTLNGAPEHTSMARQLNSGFFHVPGATYGDAVWNGSFTTVVMLDEFLDITNPSPCRALALLFSAQANGFVALTVGTNVNYILQVDVDGVQQSIVFSQSDVGSGVESGFDLTAPVALVLAPGETKSVRVRGEYQLYWGTVIDIFANLIRVYQGSTV